MNDIERSTEELRQLEEAARAGEPVAAADLSDARARATLATLAAEGAAARASHERQAAAHDVRQAAKQEAARLFEGHNGDIRTAFDAAVSAMERLIAVIKTEDARITQGELILRQGGVAARQWDGTFPDGFDPANYASMEQGGVASVITLEGTSHTRESASLWVAAAVHTVARAHGGLQLPGARGSLERRVEFDKPRALAVVYDD